MGSSAISAVRDIILNVVRHTARGDWKIVVLDDGSRRIIETVMKTDEIIQENVTNIESIEEKRGDNKSLPALYLLSPEPYVVDCLVADIQRNRYKQKYVIWTALLPPDLRQKIDRTPGATTQIAAFNILNINFFPQESHLISFRDPWSFPLLYHPACNPLVAQHMLELSDKIVSICVSLGEYPAIRYYRPRNPTHEAAVLCSHLARFVQEGLDEYAQYHKDFPPQSSRPRGTLMITDRSMDLFAPIVHEFTYQAMAHELLPLKEGDQTFYTTVVNQGTSRQEVKEMELGENDKIWVENRHLHMKDLLEKLVADFNRFRAENPQFAEEAPTTLNTIKDMIAGLPQFQQGKELYSLHLSMAQECMNVFQAHKLPDIALVEQSMATGLDEDYKKPKNVTDQIVRLLDDEAIPARDRIRLIMEYVLHRDGIFASDITKLLAHAQLPPPDMDLVCNLDLLGARVVRQIKEARKEPPPLFPPKQKPQVTTEEVSLSRFEPLLKQMLEEQIKGTLDQNVFPYTKPMIDSDEAIANQISLSQSSLRSAKPTWARTRPTANEPRKRLIVFVAGGATWSEARSCYEISRQYSRDTYLASSHMVTPSLFLQQLGDLSADRRQLDLPQDRPPRQAPAHVFEPVPAPASIPSTAPPTAAMANTSISSKPHSSNGSASGPPVPSHKAKPSQSSFVGPQDRKAEKGGEKEKEKKRRGFFKF